MKIKWLGHAAFLITLGDGRRIITDPYGKFEGLKYGEINETADVVMISHEHGDHVGGKVKGNPEIVKGPGQKRAKGIVFKGIATYHDTSRGRERGPNTVFVFTADDVTICHMGDLGEMLSQSQVDDLNGVDVLMIPVGGFYTIDAATAGKIVDTLTPKITIPMHCRTGKCEFPISDAGEFIKGKGNVRKANSTEIEVSRENLPAQPEIVVLEHAL